MDVPSNRKSIFVLLARGCREHVPHACGSLNLFFWTLEKAEVGVSLPITPHKGEPFIPPHE